MKNLITILSILIITTACNKEATDAAKPDQSVEVEAPLDDAIVEVFEEKTIWFSTTPDKVYTHLGGMVKMKCSPVRCIVEAVIYQYFINAQNIKSSGYEGELNFWPDRNAYVGGLRRVTGEEGVGFIIKDGMPLMITNQSECLLFGDSSESRDDFASMIAGKTNYYYDNQFMPYAYGIKQDEPDCAY